MKNFQEAYLKSKSLADKEFIGTFRAFGQSGEGWSYLIEESECYMAGIDSSACMLALNDGSCNYAIALAKERDGVYYVANVVPEEAGLLPIARCNTVVKRFAEAIRRFIRCNKVPMSVRLASDNVGLKDIIPSSKALVYFERYLKAWPTSYHPSDIQRLDLFICAASRCPKRIDLQDLQRYLIEDLDWLLKDAQWCAQRIEVGLYILDVNKTGYRK